MDDSIEGTKEKIAVTYPGLYDDVHEGGHVLFDDGLIDMQIEKKDDANKELVCKVLNEGTLGSRKGVNAPGVSINLPGITEKDSDDIRFGLDQDINYIAASFVRKPQDILDIRELLEEKHMEHVQIFPKIESQEGINNFDEILKVSDGLMIARGDMGVEIPAENVPLVQKSLIKKCNLAGKPVITATQMLDSMQENPRPTRAEASDVANAVFDGTDATMLSGESANGKYPVEAVRTMATIDKNAQTLLNEYGRLNSDNLPRTNKTEVVASAVKDATKSMDIKLVVTITESGNTARLISKYRPDADILALTFDEKVQKSLMINWGVIPILTEKPASTDDMFEIAEKAALKSGLVESGDNIVIVAGVPVGSGGTNTMRVRTVQ